jgi:hypothetical protein
LVAIYGLLQVIECSAAQGFLNRFDGPVGRHHHNYQRRVNLEQFAKQHHPVHSSHLVVCQHEIEIAFARESQGMLARLRGSNRVSIIFENQRVNLSLVLLVIYYQHSSSWHPYITPL